MLAISSSIGFSWELASGLAKVKELVHEGNVRRVIIKDE
jgi:hypothetical protein